MSGNTDFWRNDQFTRTNQPAPGNKTFGADRAAKKPEDLLDTQSLPQIIAGNEPDHTITSNPILNISISMPGESQSSKKRLS